MHFRMITYIYIYIWFNALQNDKLVVYCCIPLALWFWSGSANIIHKVLALLCKDASTMYTHEAYGKMVVRYIV